MELINKIIKNSLDNKNLKPRYYNQYYLNILYIRNPLHLEYSYIERLKIVKDITPKYSVRNFNYKICVIDTIYK